MSGPFIVGLQTVINKFSKRQQKSTYRCSVQFGLSIDVSREVDPAGPVKNENGSPRVAHGDGLVFVGVSHRTRVMCAV